MLIIAVFVAAKSVWLRIIWKWILRAGLGFIAVSFILVILFRWVNPSYNLTMFSRSLKSQNGLSKTWVPIERISRHMQLAVICGEDQHFTAHWGFDFESMRKAAASNARGGKVRGASTISQQTAKNVFLWGGRSYLRKAIEAWFTLLIEIIWGKKRIMEVYLNVAETGKDMFGVEAAARRYFGKPAMKLGKREAAAVASILPSPIRWKMGGYPAARRQTLILHAMNRYGIHLTYLD